MNILGWLLPRLAIRIVLMLLLLLGVFVAIDRLPGNAAISLLGADRSDSAIASIEEELGLNQPLLLRYFRWLGQLCSGDLGRSIHGQEISTLLAKALPTTLITSGVAFLATTVLTALLGTWWAYLPQKSKRFRSIDFLSSSLIALPEFVVGTILIAIFALGFRLLPAVTINSPNMQLSASMYVLPIAALTIPQVAWNARVLRAALHDVLSAEYVKHAQYAGIVGTQLMRRHVLPLAIPAFSASLATSAGVLIAGTVSVEALFNHPGVGLLVSQAVANRDIVVLLAVLTITGTFILAMMTIADALRLAFTPKVQL